MRTNKLKITQIEISILSTQHTRTKNTAETPQTSTPGN